MKNTQTNREPWTKAFLAYEASKTGIFDKLITSHNLKMSLLFFFG